jgi:hypothetical protein
MRPQFKNIPQPESAANNQADLEVQAKFQEALALHRKGQLAQACELYRQVVKVQPRHFDALHLPGVIAYQILPALWASPYGYYCR